METIVSEKFFTVVSPYLLFHLPWFRLPVVNRSPEADRALPDVALAGQ